MRTRRLARMVLSVALIAGAASACVPERGEADPPLVADPSPDCHQPRELTPEDLESFPGCDLEGFTVVVGESGGAVVPAAGEAVTSEARGADGEVREFTLSNFGTDGVALEVRTATSAQVFGPSSARERLPSVP